MIYFYQYHSDGFYFLIVKILKLPLKKVKIFQTRVKNAKYLAEGIV